MLSIVPVPIGNLQDITLRALDVLKAADIIFCEDTRLTARLCAHYGAGAKLVRYNEEDPRSLDRCLQLLQEGKNCALVSDAGTPCISDPGWKLVKAARQAGIKVTALPGASAAVTALSGAGISGGGFVFLGFTARKPGKAAKMLKEAFALQKPLIVYESPYRALKLLDLIIKNFGPDTKATVARELTKTFEEWLPGTAVSVREDLAARKKILGEFVFILDPRPQDSPQQEEDEGED